MQSTEKSIRGILKNTPRVIGKLQQQTSLEVGTKQKLEKGVGTGTGNARVVQDLVKNRNSHGRSCGQNPVSYKSKLRKISIQYR